MESWFSSNCTRNIHRPSKPEKEVNRKENTLGNIAKKAKVYSCSDIDLGEVLFHYVMFCDKEIAIFRVRFIAFLQWNFLRFVGPLKICVPFLVPVD